MATKASYEKYARSPKGKANQKRYLTTVKGRANRLLGYAAKRARSKGMGFDLTPEWVQDRLSAGVCELSGVELVLVAGKKRHPFSPSIDRRDCAGGYTQGNCRIICTMLNLALNEFGEDAFAKLAGAFMARR